MLYDKAHRSSDDYLPLCNCTIGLLKIWESHDPDCSSLRIEASGCPGCCCDSWEDCHCCCGKAASEIDPIQIISEENKMPDEKQLPFDSMAYELTRKAMNCHLTEDASVAAIAAGMAALNQKIEYIATTWGASMGRLVDAAEQIAETAERAVEAVERLAELAECD